MQWPPRPNDGAAALDREWCGRPVTAPKAARAASDGFAFQAFAVVQLDGVARKHAEAAAAAQGTAWPFHVERRGAVVGPRR